MRAQLVAHQRHAGANEAAQVLAVCRDEIGGGCGTKIEYQARARSQLAATQHRQPAIKTKAFEVLIAIAHSSHLTRGDSTGDDNTESPLQSLDQLIGLFCFGKREYHAYRSERTGKAICEDDTRMDASFRCCGGKSS
ncbi:hypothetical protein SDC9_178638 [bioreactor metagenome]|uniref:Uncharacterized protein n=1 Tax=bioreactor metagenome TaxID=1076179 RepID=A0A645H4A5_9ZZZZ